MTTIRNIDFPQVPSETLAPVDPSSVHRVACYSRRLPRVTFQEAQKRASRDWDRFLLCLLAEVHMIPTGTMREIVTCVPDGVTRHGMEIWFQRLQSRWGIEFDSQVILGGLHTVQSANTKLYESKRLPRELIRTVWSGSGNLRLRKGLREQGLTSVWTLTPMGAACLIRLSSLDLSKNDVWFPANPNQVAVTSQLHGIQEGNILGTLILGANYYNNRDYKKTEILVDVLDVRGDNTDYVVSGKKFRPDMGGAILFRVATSKGERGIVSSFFIENDTGSGSERVIKDKVLAYLRFMTVTPDGAFTASVRPWLFMVYPEGDGKRTKKYERAIKSAVQENGVNRATEPNAIGRIAIATHQDIGAKSPYGNVWRVFDYERMAVAADKYPLISLGTPAANPQSLLRVNSHPETTPQKAEA